MQKRLNTLFESVFDIKAQATFFAPGRINLIGEHIDYLGGHVFPCAITQGTYGLVHLREDERVRLYSDNFKDKGIIEVTLDNLDYQKEDGWANYVKGMLKYTQEAGHTIGGMDILFYGNIPNGTGLSSSASLEMCVAIILETCFGLGVTKLQWVQYGVKTENDYIGLSSGIMDQFAIMFSKENHALLLNTQTLKYETVPLDLGEHVIVIMNTNKQRTLADSKYNQRRQECDDALTVLQRYQYKENLCDYTLEDLDKVTLSEVSYKRARHAISENQRTLKAAHVLKEGDLVTFGKLMNASHASLKDDYEVTGEELDTIVRLSLKEPSVLGARVTGAGFGGCAIAIVNKDTVSSFIHNVGKQYEKEIGYQADFYIATPGMGARES